ncbi:alpha/beta hydrolase fold domain-containing protein [Catenulispora rubra]|uniref:alpha/beta hydrolase fold domain-containing protein n=1 Tax=Catenulispora rubra TaxID=280293 RepID=UPI0018922F3F|nr:alpha/beta hydrolase [Catenulispora rubra]
MAGDVRIEMSPVGPIVRPQHSSEAVVLYLHGDRHLANDSAPARLAAGRIALASGAPVLCCDYDSAFPTALEDVQDGFEYCQELGPTAVVGERQGAGLGVALMLRLRDHGVEPPQCGVLISALLDLTLEAPSVSLNAAADPTFDITLLRGRAAAYAAGTVRTDPSLSPVYGNLHGLPPIRLLAAGNDPLLDDSLAFASRAARSGVSVDLSIRLDAAALESEAVAAAADFIRAWAPARRTSRLA